MPITLRFNRREVTYLALLDSGADFNIFHADIAKILRIDLTKVKTKTAFTGIKKEARGTGVFITIEIGVDGQFINTIALFSNDISEDGYGILGQQGFFNKYTIRFDYTSRKFHVEE